MYSAKDGIANEWHFSHLSTFARAKIGCIFAEATAIREEGKITPYCLGLWNDDQKNAILDKIPMKKLGESNDIAKAVGFLCSENASYITGQTLHVNGGLALI